MAPRHRVAIAIYAEQPEEKTVKNQLEESAALRSNLDAVLNGPAKAPAELKWLHELEAFISMVRNATPADLRHRPTLERIWDDNPVSAVGNGTVKMAPALENDEFVSWFAQLATTKLSEDNAKAEVELTALYDELTSRLQVLCGRTPRLKANRVLCSLFPEHFTTIADEGALRYLHREMGGSRKDHPVHAHMAIRRRIDDMLGLPSPTDPLDALRRTCLPWMLYERIANDQPPKSAAPTAAEARQLSPMPATLRRKGLTAMKGGFQTLLSLLPPLDEGVSRDEFVALIGQVNPDLAERSHAPFINVVAREFDLCIREGDLYRLSARGINLLETQDPHELADHLLTRVLGIDHVIRSLATGPASKTALVAMLQRVNPGWTTTFAPTAQIGWLVSLGVIDATVDRRYQLTELGQRWNELVTWEPEYLPKPAGTVEELRASVDEAIQLPTWAELTLRLSALSKTGFRFDDSLVRQLHAGLWFHPVRHFAVLTGLSGSGKTQLALHYAKALCGDAAMQDGAIKVVPIQPGWFDPSPLLGYVSPLHQAAYRSAPFLDLVLRAVDNPAQPHVAVLDEMNLSHPEQYLAPILSAMETRGVIDLHQLTDGSTEVPRSFIYPANLVIIGTVNMDETTHGLSDKVLDRAFTLEFWNIKVSDFPRWGSSGLAPALRDKAQQVLQALGDVFAPLRLHFGWRTIDDVVSYLAFATHQGAEDNLALDEALYAKVLPKLRGESSRRFEAALGAAKDLMREHGLVRCHEKLAAMQVDLAETGAARFWR